MAHTYRTRKLVPFADTDMAGIVHFTNYMKYMEEAEHAFLRSHDLSVVMHDERGAYGFPKLSAACDYRRPVRHEEWLDIALEVETSDGKTINYRATIDHEGQRIAEGTIQVACFASRLTHCPTRFRFRTTSSQFSTRSYGVHSACVKSIPDPFENEVRNQNPERPFGCFALLVPAPFFDFRCDRRSRLRLAVKQDLTAVT